MLQSRDGADWISGNLANAQSGALPEGGDAIPNPIGTAPGLLCELPGGKVMYAVPGVPYEMQQMVRDHVIPDLLRRSGEAAAIVSRSLKTWGTSESALAEMVAHRLDALDARGGNPTIAFLARGIEGLVVRVTAKGATEREARALVKQRIAGESPPHKPFIAPSSTPARGNFAQVMRRSFVGPLDQWCQIFLIQRVIVLTTQKPGLTELGPAHAAVLAGGGVPHE